jgi:hypothetical protein
MSVWDTPGAAECEDSRFTGRSRGKSGRRVSGTKPRPTYAVPTARSRGGRSIRGRVASGVNRRKAPADPDEPDYRTRLFGARPRFLTIRVKAPSASAIREAWFRASEGEDGTASRLKYGSRLSQISSARCRPRRLGRTHALSNYEVVRSRDGRSRKETAKKRALMIESTTAIAMMIAASAIRVSARTHSSRSALWANYRRIP